MKDPVTGRPISDEDEVRSVITDMALAAIGASSFDNEIGTHVAGAYGFISELPEVAQRGGESTGG
ncbi:MAG TPA: hypothetical protein VMS00_09950 [Acidimicrobiales bacterium]|nr:hypothetical protein [Acidimicrobiales bacterium]